MGDILSKLQMVSEKIGVTETAHTIEEQVDLISESLDKIPASTNIAEALDDLSEVAQNINNEEVYVDKTITENGTYLPAQDEATAYSKVVVDVENELTFTQINYYNGTRNVVDNLLIWNSKNGIYDMKVFKNVLSDTYNGNTHCILLTPCKNVITDFTTTSFEHITFTFTPDNDYEWISDESIIPGDGKIHGIRLDYGGSSTAIVNPNSSTNYFTPIIV